MSAATLLRRFHEAEGRFFESGGKEWPSFEGILHPDFVLTEPHSGPYGGEWRGLAGLERFLRAMNDDWSEMGPSEPPELIEQRETVIALATIEAVGRATGRRVTFPLCQGFAVLGGVPQRLLELGDDWKSWVLIDRDPVVNWTDGRVTLLGDAAHPMLHYAAQGACQALEDAVVLGACGRRIRQGIRGVQQPKKATDRGDHARCAREHETVAFGGCRGAREKGDAQRDVCH